MSAFRLYAESECGPDGYPPEWHELPIDHPLLDEADMVLPGGIKDVVRALAGHRCIRCRHPYGHGRPVGPKGEWTPCDRYTCDHGGPIRYRFGIGAFCGFGSVASDGWPALRTRLTVGQLASVEVEAQWRILTVHHLNERKEDCRWHNLVALCQRLRCHLQVQGRVKMGQVYPFEHSSWFKPYAAAYYASTYLGEELTREETVARLDELLALERAA